MRLRDIMVEFAHQYEDFYIESVSTEDRRAIIEELRNNPDWKIDDWIKSAGNMWMQFSVKTTALTSYTISINDGEGDLFDCICCFF